MTGETMADGYIWLRCYLPKGKQIDFHVTSRGKIHVKSEADETPKKGKK